MADDASDRCGAELARGRLAHQHQRSGAVGDARRVGRGDRAILLERRFEAGDLVELGLARLLVVANHRVTGLGRNRHRRDLPVEAAVFVGQPRPGGRGDRELVLRLAAESVLVHALLGENTHRLAAAVGKTFISVFEPVDRHVVEHLRRAIANTLASKHQVRRVGHALHATGHHHRCRPCSQHVVREHHRPHPRAAHLGQSDRASAVGQTGATHRLARRGLTLAGHQAVAHQHLVDGVARHARALDRGANRHRAQLPGSERRELPQQAGDGRAGGRDDDDGFRHGLLLDS